MSLQEQISDELIKHNIQLDREVWENLHLILTNYVEKRVDSKLNLAPRIEIRELQLILQVIQDLQIQFEEDNATTDLKYVELKQLEYRISELIHKHK